MIFLKTTDNKNKKMKQTQLLQPDFSYQILFFHQLCHIATEHAHVFLRLQAEGMKSLPTVFRFSWERWWTRMSLLCPFIPTTLHLRADSSFSGCFSDSLSPQCSFLAEAAIGPSKRQQTEQQLGKNVIAAGREQQTKQAHGVLLGRQFSQLMLLSYLD